MAASLQPISSGWADLPAEDASPATRELQAEQVLADIEEAARDRPGVVKNTAHQAACLLGPDLLRRFDNCLLVRDPAATLRSLARTWPDFTDEGTGSRHLDEAARIADSLGQP